MPKLIHLGGEGHPLFITTSCIEREPLFLQGENAIIAVRTINRLRKDGAWWVSEYVIMPDHVHLIISPIKPVGYCMQEFKKSVARIINKRHGLVGRKIWLDEYHERVIRDDREYAEKVNYIWCNPVKRNLCITPEEYPFSTARPEASTDRDKFY